MSCMQPSVHSFTFSHFLLCRSWRPPYSKVNQMTVTTVARCCRCPRMGVTCSLSSHGLYSLWQAGRSLTPGVHCLCCPLCFSTQCHVSPEGPLHSGCVTLPHHVRLPMSLLLLSCECLPLVWDPWFANVSCSLPQSLLHLYIPCHQHDLALSVPVSILSSHSQSLGQVLSCVYSLHSHIACHRALRVFALSSRHAPVTAVTCLTSGYFPSLRLPTAVSPSVDYSIAPQLL